MKDFALGVFVVTLVICIAIGALWGFVWGWQYFKVFSATQSGRAELAQAEWNRQITIKTAEANNQAAVFNAEATIKVATAQAQAEIERAKGVAEANKIIADSLEGNDDYLKYLWIDKLGAAGQVIYVPTEAGLPILEAGKRQ